MHKKWDYDALWGHVASTFHGEPQSDHGPAHWKRVHDFGLLTSRT